MGGAACCLRTGLCACPVLFPVKDGRSHFGSSHFGSSCQTPQFITTEPARIAACGCEARKGWQPIVTIIPSTIVRQGPTSRTSPSTKPSCEYHLQREGARAPSTTPLPDNPVPQGCWLDCGKVDPRAHHNPSRGDLDVHLSSSPIGYQPYLQIALIL